jgi:transposase
MKKKGFSFGKKHARKGRVIEVAKKNPDLERINHQAAGIDIGSESHFVAVPPESCPTPVKQFGVFTRDLYAIADWLQECGVKTVAMESTGVYWVPLYEVLEERGFAVKLVDPGKAKNVSGRKTDVLDCQWLQQLHSYGLLAGAFRPADEIVVLRGYTRQREMLVKSAATHIQHMQKALQQMNLRLDNVVSDITGETGMRILKAILGGERDVKKLGEMRDRRCQASAEEIAESLVGNYRQEHLFSLKQAVELFETYQEKILECETEMEKYLKSLPHKREDEPPPLPEGEKRNRLSFNVRDETWKLTGVDLFRINGLNSETVLRITSEVGVDVASRFPTEKQFSSWLGLSPNNKITGGKVLSSKTKTSSNRAAAAFRQAAVSAERSQSEIGAFYRRKKAHLGPAQAVTATAHKIARIYYHLMKTGEEYVDGGAQASDKKYQERVLSNLKKRARGLGFELVAVEQ